MLQNQEWKARWPRRFRLARNHASFCSAIATPRWEGYEFEYVRREDGSPGNRFAYLGAGFIPKWVGPSKEDSPHTAIRHIDKIWIEAVGLEIKEGEIRDGRRAGSARPKFADLHFSSACLLKLSFHCLYHASALLYNQHF